MCGFATGTSAVALHMSKMKFSRMMLNNASSVLIPESAGRHGMSGAAAVDVLFDRYGVTDYDIMRTRDSVWGNGCDFAD